MGLKEGESKEVKKKYVVTNVTDPDKVFRKNLEKVLKYFAEVDPLGMPADRSKLAIAITNNYVELIERTKPKRFDAHNLF